MRPPRHPARLARERARRVDRRRPLFPALGLAAACALLATLYASGAAPAAPPPHVPGAAPAAPLAPRSPLSPAAATANAAPGRHASGASPAPLRPLPGPTGWADAGVAPLRGVTIGPIENRRHEGRGYGSAPYARAVGEAVRMGATWVSLTPFGRVADLAPTGIDKTFEAPFAQNRADVARAIAMAHDAGLKVLLVPHLWVESGGWRGLIEPGSDAAWARYAAAYRGFVVEWARLAQEAGADMLSVGVEQRTWVTTRRAALYADVIDAVRAAYRGPLTYSGNWDDIEDTLVVGALDVIGVNAFYPLAERDGASFDELARGAERVAERVRRLAERWQKPVLFTEIGYTTRPDPAVRPWEWPDAMADVRVDERAQADAYAALIAPLLAERCFLGFFVWRLYADPDDTSQEAEWGFSPRGKLAELVVRDAFRARWAADPFVEPGDLPGRTRALFPGFFGPSRP
jgi:glycosyl hydrolase family 113